MSFSERLQAHVVRILRWSEKYTKTDMVYLASGGFWTTIELVAAAIFSFILAIVFGHYASQDLYGNYKYVLSIAALLSGVSLTGMGTAITQAASRGKEGALKQGLRLNLCWSIPMSLIALCVAVYYYLQNNPFVAISMCIVAFVSPFLYSFSLFDNFLVGKRQFSRSAIFSVIGNLASMFVLVAALFFGGRAIILVIAYFAINTATAVYFYMLTVRSAKNDETDPDMLRYGFHLSVMGVIGSIANQIDSITIFALLGPAQLAVYTYAIAMPEQIKAVVKNVTPLSMPKFAQRSMADIRKNIWGRIVLFTLGLTLCILFYIVVSPILFRVLFPVYYVSSTEYSQWYALSIILTGGYTVLSSVLQAHKKTRALYISSNGSALLLIVALPVLTYFYGITGAVISQFIYRFVAVLLATWQFILLDDGNIV